MLTVAPLHGSAWTDRASTSDHGPLALVLTGTSDGVMAEWCQRTNREPLGAECRETREIVNALDALMSHRSLGGKQDYWSFVKEFMKPMDQKCLKKEWRVSSARGLSIAWLKDSLNKQTMAYYLQSFIVNPEILRKHYEPDAAIASHAVMSRVTKKFIEMIDVRFKILKSFERNSNVPIAEIRSTETENPRSKPLNVKPSNTSESAANLAQNNGASELLDVVLPSNFVEQQPPLNEYAVLERNDPDQIFIDVLRRQEQSIFIRKEFISTQNNDDVFDTAPKHFNLESSHMPMQPPLVDPFVIAMKSSLSKNKINVTDEPQIEQNERLSPITSNIDLPYGEIRLDMGEVIGLTINVFKHDAERFLRMFQIFTNFGTGTVEKRLLALSNQAIYIASLKQYGTQTTYATHDYLPFQNIEHINVSPDYQVLYLHANVSFNVDETKQSFSSVIEVCAACKQLGITIAEAVKYAHDNAMCSSGKKELELFCNFTPYHLILQRFMSRELQQDDANLLSYFLVQWRQTNLYSSTCEGYQHSGFLYHKEVRNKVSWLFSKKEFEYSYFHLENKKLYQFTNSTCKVGERVISLSDSVQSVVELKGNKDSPYMFEVCLNTGSRIHFICQNVSDLHKWVSLLSFAITSLDSSNMAIPCVLCVNRTSILIAQEGLNCVIDGFMRLLAKIDLSSVLEAIGVFDEERSACVLNDGEKLEWLMMRSPDEIDRLLSMLHKLGVKKIGSDEGGSSRLSAILHSMPNSSNIFYFEKLMVDDSFETTNDIY